MVIAAADRFTIENSKVRTFSDFLIGFDKNPMTGLLALAHNEEAVKQSIKNLVLTQRTERFYRAATGSKITSLLFDPIDNITSLSVENAIRETIKNSEPRAKLISVEVAAHVTSNLYVVSIVFSIVSSPDLTFNMSLILRRVR